jgi:hypothetical protein
VADFLNARNWPKQGFSEELNALAAKSEVFAKLEYRI